MFKGKIDRAARTDNLDDSAITISTQADLDGTKSKVVNFNFPGTYSVVKMTDEEAQDIEAILLQIGQRIPNVYDFEKDSLSATP